MFKACHRLFISSKQATQQFWQTSSRWQPENLQFTVHFRGSDDHTAVRRILYNFGKPQQHWCTCSAVRGFHTSPRAEAATGTDGPRKEKITAVPFRVSPQEAAEAFTRYHSRNFFLTQPSAGLQKVKESFLPFWVTSAEVQVRLNGARVGYDAWEPVYNPATRRYENQLRTSWRFVRLSQRWQRSYSAADEGMQVYASYKYPRAEAHRLRPGRAVEQAAEFTSRMLTSSDGETRRVGPFHMKPATALRFVSDWMRQQETDAVTDFIRRAFDCDRVAALDMDVNITAMRSSPLYVPAFIFRSQHFGTKMHTFVSGISSQQAGRRAYDEGKTAVLAGLAASAGILMSQGAAAFASAATWIWGVALPMTVAGLVTHYLAALQQAWARFWQQREQQRHAEGDQTGAWDAEWVHAYSQYEERRRRMDEQERSEYFGSFSGAAQSSGADPLGYYALMGLEPSCTKQEIQAAFRGLAMKWHPDKVPESEKAAAEKRFQKLNEAYSVLRDPAKRRQYDRR